MEQSEIVELVKSASVELNGVFTRSKRGVPYIVVKVTGVEECFSVCYFASTAIWRVFYPCYSHNRKQQKWDFGSVDKVKEFFTNIEGDKCKERLRFS